MSEQPEDDLAEVRASRRRILDAADADRRMLERLLHDGLQQDLVVTSANLQLLSRHLDGSAAAAELMADLKQSASEAHRRAAELAEMLYPPLLDARSLASAIRAAAGLAGVTLRLEAAEPLKYPADTLNALYWTCLEAVSAVPSGSELSIDVRREGSSVAFEVGTSATLDGGRLQRLRDRVQASGGEVGLRQGPGHRRVVYGTLPLSA